MSITFISAFKNISFQLNKKTIIDVCPQFYSVSNVPKTEYFITYLQFVVFFLLEIPPRH